MVYAGYLLKYEGLRDGQLSGLFFVPAVLFSYSFISSYLLPLFICLISILLFPRTRKCSREHSCMSFSFSRAILNGTCSLLSTITTKTFRKWSDIKQNSKNKTQPEIYFQQQHTVYVECGRLAQLSKTSQSIEFYCTFFNRVSVKFCRDCSDRNLITEE